MTTKMKTLLLLAGSLLFLGVGRMPDVVNDTLAVVGRPLTPMSYAGVARRTTRRTVAATAAVAAPPVVVAPAPVAVAPYW
jgi:hypothetical protein